MEEIYFKIKSFIVSLKNFIDFLKKQKLRLLIIGIRIKYISLNNFFYQKKLMV